MDATEIKMSEPKEYRKVATVKAIIINEPFTVNTLEGIMIGKEGDYLVSGINGERWVVDKDIFEKTYIEVENKNITRLHLD